MAAARPPLSARSFLIAGYGSLIITTNREALRLGAIGTCGNTPATENADCDHAAHFRSASRTCAKPSEIFSAATTRSSRLSGRNTPGSPPGNQNYKVERLK